MKPRSHLRSTLITLAIAGGAVAYAVLVFVPCQKALARLRAQLRDKQHQIVASDRLITVIAATEDQLRATRGFIADWEAHASSEARLADVYRQFATAAERAQVQLGSIRPQNTQRGKAISQVGVALDCSGPYANIFEFIHLVESTGPNLWLPHVEVSRPDDPKGKVQCKLLITIFSPNSSLAADNPETSG